MTYLKDFEDKLALEIDNLLRADKGEDENTAKKDFMQWVKSEIIKSYRNGLEFGTKTDKRVMKKSR